MSSLKRVNFRTFLFLGTLLLLSYFSYSSCKRNPQIVSQKSKGLLSEEEDQESPPEETSDSDDPSKDSSDEEESSSSGQRSKAKSKDSKSKEGNSKEGNSKENSRNPSSKSEVKAEFFPLIKDFESFKAQYGQDCQALKNDNSDIPTSIMPGAKLQIPLNARSVEPFATSLLPMFHAESSTVKIHNTQGSLLSESYSLLQKYEGYEVYQGNISVHVSKEEGTLFMVNNNLKETKNFDSKMNFSKEQAESELKKNLAEASAEPEFIQFKKGPVLFTDPKTNQSELAWVFHVRIKSKSKSMNLKEMVISSLSGKSLHSQPLVLH